MSRKVFIKNDGDIDIHFNHQITRLRLEGKNIRFIHNSTCLRKIEIVCDRLLELKNIDGLYQFDKKIRYFILKF